MDSDESETKHEQNGEPTALISARDETIRVLEEQLRKESVVRRRADTIIAQLTQANAALAALDPKLRAPRETPGDTETAAEEPGAYTLGEPSGGAREAAETRSWWQRKFFGT